MPDLQPTTFVKKQLGCPSLFPPFPIQSSLNGGLEFHLVSLMEELLSKKEKTCVSNYIRNAQSTSKEEKAAVSTIANLLQRFASDCLSRKDPFLRSFDWNKAAFDLLSMCKKNDRKFSETMDASLVMLGLKQKDTPITKDMLQALIAKFDDYIEKATSLIADTEAEIEKQAGAPNLELVSELNELKQLRESYLRDREMSALWMKGSLFPSIGKMMVRMDTIKHCIIAYPGKMKGKPLIVGGCIQHLENKTAEWNSLAHELLECYGEELSKCPFETLRMIQHRISGVCFKIPFVNFEIIDEDERMESLGYYCIPHSPYRYLENRAQSLAFDAIGREDETDFIKLAQQITDWNFKDPFGSPILHYGARSRNPIFLRYILEQEGVDLLSLDSEGVTALHDATRYGHLDNAQILLDKAPQLIDGLSPTNLTPLALAVFYNQRPCVELLLKKGANPNLCSTMGMNPLMSALFLGHEEVTLAILKRNTTNLENYLQDRSTALHLAVQSQMKQVLEYLCRSGCDARRTRLDGYNPLHIAAEQGWLEGVKLLLTHCFYIDSKARTKAGATALQLAEQHQHEEVAALLRK